MYHTNAQIEAAASALGNQLAAGIKVREAVARMAKLQPVHAALWADAAEALSRGGRLSQQLASVWPESIVAALKAGEESDSLPIVFNRTAETMRVKAQVRKIFGKLSSPAIAFAAGFGVFLFFMVAVIPKLQSQLGGGEADFTFTLAMFLNKLIMGYWPLVLLASGGVIAGVIYLLKQPETLNTVVSMGNDIPKLGEALRNLYFGLWAYQIAMLDSAGLPVRQQLLLSIKTLPECYQAGVALMAEEVAKRGIADSSDPEKQGEGDPRGEWPFYIATAFITAHETGRVDQEMSRCAPILIDEGIRKLSQFIAVADLVAKTLAASMIAMPLMAYFTQLSSSLTKAFS